MSVSHTYSMTGNQPRKIHEALHNGNFINNFPKFATEAELPSWMDNRVLRSILLDSSVLCHCRDEDGAKTSLRRLKPPGLYKFFNLIADRTHPPNQLKIDSKLNNICGTSLSVEDILNLEETTFIVEVLTPAYFEQVKLIRDVSGGTKKPSPVGDCDVLASPPAATLRWSMVYLKLADYAFEVYKLLTTISSAKLDEDVLEAFNKRSGLDYGLEQLKDNLRIFWNPVDEVGEPMTDWTHSWNKRSPSGERMLCPWLRSFESHLPDDAEDVFAFFVKLSEGLASVKEDNLPTISKRRDVGQALESLKTAREHFPPESSEYKPAGLRGGGSEAEPKPGRSIEFTRWCSRIGDTANRTDTEFFNYVHSTKYTLEDVKQEQGKTQKAEQEPGSSCDDPIANRLFETFCMFGTSDGRPPSKRALGEWNAHYKQSFTMEDVKRVVGTEGVMSWFTGNRV